MVNCPKCGKENTKDSVYCQECGTQIKTSTEKKSKPDLKIPKIGYLPYYRRNIACILTHWFIGSLPFPPRATLAAGSLSGAGFLQFTVGSAILVRGP
ncbi:MAG TPA: zinc ribbon domain-containing protein [Methanobacterium sp.]|nr:MAG: zinc-ribbon domain-containing protein [Methanobacterium sp.]HOI70789.1 zinc ribbon domain-containing protein [Methanobacterium sp.]